MGHQPGNQALTNQWMADWGINPPATGVIFNRDGCYEMRAVAKDECGVHPTQAETSFQWLLNLSYAGLDQYYTKYNAANTTGGLQAITVTSVMPYFNSTQDLVRGSLMAITLRAKNNQKMVGGSGMMPMVAVCERWNTPASQLQAVSITSGTASCQQPNFQNVSKGSMVSGCGRVMTNANAKFRVYDLCGRSDPGHVGYRVLGYETGSINDTCNCAPGYVCAESGSAIGQHRCYLESKIVWEDNSNCTTGGSCACFHDSSYGCKNNFYQNNVAKQCAGGGISSCTMAAPDIVCPAGETAVTDTTEGNYGVIGCDWDQPAGPTPSATKSCSIVRKCRKTDGTFSQTENIAGVCRSTWGQCPRPQSELPWSDYNPPPCPVLGSELE